jgi:hypothetical protein
VPEAAAVSASEEVGAPLEYRVPEAVRGVDLNLNGFDLTVLERAEVPKASRDGCALAGSGFWTQIMTEGVGAGNEELAFLRDVFKSDLSDRRDEGEHFVGPSMSASYLHKLQGLVQEETKVKEERLAHFISEDFVLSNAGPLFPASWASSVESPGQGNLQLEVCLFEDAVDLATLKASVAPIFDKGTEDGVRFRVYRWKGFEVRTWQGCKGPESIGVVFSMGESERGCIRGAEKVVKITQYVSFEQRAQEGNRDREQQRFRYQLLLETESGHHIATEGRLDGQVAWEEQPADLEERRASWKTLGAVDCSKARITVQDVRRYTEAHGAAFTTSNAGCKRYAKGLYNWACSQVGKDPRGFERYISAKTA